VKPSLSFAFLLLAGLTGVLAADADKDKIDFSRPETPKKPAPEWLKLVDLGKQDRRLEGYKAPQGFKVEIVAEAPTVVNPVGMTFGDDGTPYVLEWRPSPGDDWREKTETFTFKDGSKHNVATMTKRVQDVVKVLRDTKGKGVYDEAKVILEEELPSSILLHDGWMYLSGRGTVRRYKQSKADGPYDVKEVIAQGFCGFHHHQVSGMTIGHDGWLYITAGDDDNNVEGSDGSRATVLRTGAVFRCKPDGSKMQTYAMGFRNPYRDVAFDSAFNMFHADNDNEDGSKFMGCRLMHIAEGSDFGWRLRQGARCCSPDPVRGAVYGELPGKVPPLCKTGRGAPAGLLIYNDTRLPEQYRGLLFYPDVFRKLIRAYHVEPDGASFVITEEFEFLSAPKDPLFRPCQMVLGPDGAIYVVDWRTDSGGAGRLWGDGKNGRIYRISWTGVEDQPELPLRPMDSWSKIRKLSDDDLIKTLGSEDASFRDRARLEIVKRGDKLRPALLKLLKDSDNATEEARIAALGALQSMWNADVQKVVVAQLGDGASAIRRLAADALALNATAGDKDVQDALLKTLNDNHLGVRRAVAMAMSHLKADGAADALVNTLAFDDSDDVQLRDGLIRAIEGLGKPGIDRLLELANSGSSKDTHTAVTAFVAMRTRVAAEALPSLLKCPEIKPEERARVYRSYANYLLDPPLSLTPLLDHALAHPEEPVIVKLAILDALSVSNALQHDKSAIWVETLLKAKDLSLRLAAIKVVEEGHIVKVAPRLARLLPQSESVVERAAMVRALRVLKDPSALFALKEILNDTKSTTDDAASLRREAFRALAAIDPASAADQAESFLTRKDLELQRDAVRVLAASVEKTRKVAQLYLDNKLPRELLPEVTEALRKHATKDTEAAKVLAEIMKRSLMVSNNPKEVERLSKLVGKQGDPMRGRALYLNGKTLACINCHRLEGIGGSVGPDLTRLWDTHSLEKIVESILEPSKEIKEGYQTFSATTKKGITYNGLKISQSADEIVLREATGRDVRLALKDLEEPPSASKVSLMPDNAISLLNYDQFIDLLAFLRDRKAQESLRGLALDFWVVGPFGDDLKKAYPPEDKLDLQAEYTGDKGAKVKWQPAQAEGDGFLNLKAIFNRDNASAYALTHVYSAKAQKAQMLLGSDDTVRVWLNGTMVHEYTTARSAKADEDKVDVRLKQGWNVVLVKVVNGEADHGLFLRFAGEGLRVARSPIEDKVPGAK
jgi:putative membrane-bound dehydrogenase-like protein